MQFLTKVLSQVEKYVPFVVMIGLAVATGITLVGQPLLAHTLVFWILLIGIIPFLKNILVSFAHKEFGVDLLAAVSIISSLVIGEYIAGAVILLMLSGGEALENFALGRARKELSHLLANAPTIAHRKKGQTITDIKAEEVKVDDILVIKPGEVIPVDGIILNGASTVDESALTGESIPVEKTVHAHVMSGSTNGAGLLEVRALHASKDSNYERIINLVRAAEKEKAPFVRLADRYSVWFTLIAFIVAGLGWIISGDPARALAVLVVATPCPLILATPIAFASGISRAAKRGIIIKNGRVIEQLAKAKSFLFDKTGTLTLGTPTLHEIETFGGLTQQKVLCLSASLDQLSNHILAKSLVNYATTQRCQLTYPTDFNEDLGNGVTGKLDKKTYILGKLTFLKQHKVSIPASVQHQHDELQSKGIISVYLAAQDTLVGVIYFKDKIRSNAKAVFTKLRSQIKIVVMATGDKAAVAQEIGTQLGITDVRSELLPENKLAIITELKKTASPVVMVGDGVNDAPALAASDVGISMSAHGASAASEAGDIAIMVDDVGRVTEALTISKRVLFIATQCIAIGISLSIILMIAAMFGYVKPVYGAMLQEVIDVIVILNALRVHQR